MRKTSLQEIRDLLLPPDPGLVGGKRKCQNWMSDGLALTMAQYCCLVKQRERQLQREQRVSPPTGGTGPCFPGSWLRARLEPLWRSPAPEECDMELGQVKRYGWPAEEGCHPLQRLDSSSHRNMPKEYLVWKQVNRENADDTSQPLHPRSLSPCPLTH